MNAAVEKAASRVTAQSAIADAKGRKIGILVVAYNAVTTLVNKVLKRIPPDVWDNVAEVAIFDDSSQDHTYELALGFKAADQRAGEKLTVLRNARNQGYGGNQKRGYQYFIDKGFDIVILLHGDGQYAPEILASMYRPIVEDEADAVFGSRMMPDYGGPLQGGMPLYKFVGNRILTFFENRALGMNLSEFHSGYRAYNLHALRKLDLSKMTDDFHFDTEIIVKLRHQGMRIREVPIPTYYGGEICYVNGMRYARDVVRAVLRYRRTVNSIEAAPEFEEYWVHYPIKTSRYSSHDFLWHTAGRNQRILELGCGEGFIASRLASMGHRVVGVDLLDQPKHADAMECYFAGDLDHGLDRVRHYAESAGKRFDLVLLMDVLEHLPNPEKVLAQCSRVLDSDGKVLVSLPNVANITVRLLLLSGRFDYTARGILDRTHLRFFTRKSARALLRETGYEIVSEMITVIPLELALGLTAENPVMRVLNRLLRLATVVWPTLFGYQFMFLARPRSR
ncbi:MAG: methyltransferase domain-containing protein [Bryobacteraceae bacterium]